jgi:hypothetical protein
MRKLTLVPLPAIPTTIHGATRAALLGMATKATADCESFSSGEEQNEYFTILRDWALANLANHATLRSVPAAGGHTSSD